MIKDLNTNARLAAVEAGDVRGGYHGLDRLQPIVGPDDQLSVEVASDHGNENGGITRQEQYLLDSRGVIPRPINEHGTPSDME